MRVPYKAKTDLSHKPWSRTGPAGEGVIGQVIDFIGVPDGI